MAQAKGMDHIGTGGMIPKALRRKANRSFCKDVSEQIFCPGFEDVDLSRCPIYQRPKGGKVSLKFI